jgi:hypothetical protein
MTMENPSENRRSVSASSTRALVIQSVIVLLSNAIPLYGVLALGWNSFALVLLFVLEGFIILGTDVVKRFFIKPTQKKRGILFFECVFIFFFGFFALMVFGPSDLAGSSFAEKIRLVKTLFVSQIRAPLLGIALFRLVRLGQDMAAAGLLGSRFTKPLEYSGGGWMFLLFFAVMTAPFIAKTGPNPMGGLAALVVLKTLGETFGVWAWRIVQSLPNKAKGKKP